MSALTPICLIHDAVRRHWLRFSQPVKVLSSARLSDVSPILDEVDRAVRNGLFAAGFIAYEAAPAFDPALQVQATDSFPLVWFGLFNEPHRIPKLDGPPSEPTPELNWTASVTPDQYCADIRKIREYIRQGDTYQVNYTYRLWSSFSGHPRAWCQELTASQGAPYAAFIETDEFAVCSASPELFFHLKGAVIESRPMKGTAPRGLTLADDRQQAEQLHQSEKNRAENVMIVDMVRNDLGRIARPGSVHAPRLFTLEKYPTVWQMTSTVAAETDASFPEICQALFPPASVTGAPKVRTMEIIRELESTPRHIYTGSIGYLGPERRGQFNVAIRTVLVDKVRGRAEYGVGGGIVWDSVDQSEFEESQTKARILFHQPPRFSLLETMLWTPGDGCFLLERHIARLRDSAEYFSFPLDCGAVREKLNALAASLSPQPHRVRLLIDPEGAMVCEAQLLSMGSNAPLRVCLAPTPIDRADPFLYHKTTHRQVYEEACAKCPGYDEVLLWNAAGEVTEFTLANLVAELEGVRYTPPVQCGLLPGTYRAWLLDQGQVKERVIRRDELKSATRLWRVNSVRKEQPVLLDRG